MKVLFKNKIYFSLLIFALTFSISVNGFSMDLTSLLGPTEQILLLDDNGDGFPDNLNTFLVVPDLTNEAQNAGVANVAARLGFETMGIDLPIVKDSKVPSENKIPILFDIENDLVKKEELKANQGLMQILNNKGTSSIYLGGADEFGVLAVSNYFAGRFPFIWAIGENELKLDGLKDDILRYLSIKQDQISVRKVIVESGKAGLVNVEIKVVVDSEEQANNIVERLNQLNALHKDAKDLDKIYYKHIQKIDFEIEANKKKQMISLLNYEKIPDLQQDSQKTIEPNDYDLSSLYGGWEDLLQKTDGLLGDTLEHKPFLEKVKALDKPVKDFIPDTTQTMIITDGGRFELEATANFAARLGLETTGINLPLAKPLSQVGDITSVINPILFGSNHPLVKNLLAMGKIDFDGLVEGEGSIEIVPKAFGTSNAIVVGGRDNKGLAAASDYLARRLPYLWSIGRGYTTISDVEDETKKFFEVKSLAGQAAEAVAKVDDIIKGIGKKSNIDLTVYLELPFGMHENRDLSSFFEKRIQNQLPGSVAHVNIKSMKDPKEIFTMEWSDAGELSEFWQLYNSVAETIGDGKGISIDLRISEPPEVLDEIQSNLHQLAPQAEIQIISAHKQGFSWLDRIVGLHIEGKPIEEITITFQDFYKDGVNASNWKFWRRCFKDPEEIWMELPTVWLQQLFPIDDVWLKNYGIDRSKVKFERIVKEDPNTPLTEPIYTVRVDFEDDSPSYFAEFSPTYVEYDYHPEEGAKNFKVHPNTGNLKIAKGGKTIIDQRIKTDVERYWVYYRDQVWPAMRAYMDGITDGIPTFDKMPFFKECRHEITMSEPNYLLGLEEVDLSQVSISSSEGLYEDLFYRTLDWAAVWVGATTFPDRNTAIGKTSKWMKDAKPGDPPSATVTLSGFNSRKPRVVLKANGKTYDIELTGVAMDRPRAIKATVNGNSNGLAKLNLEVNVENQSSQEKAFSMLSAIKQIHAYHVLKEELSWPMLNELNISLNDATSIPVNVSIPKVATRSTEKLIGPTTGVELPKEGSIVRYDGVIGYEENNAILKRLDSSPEVNVWLAEKSFEGRNSFVAEAMCPINAELYSHAKAITWKPALMITARRHANEISSTNSTLRLLEQLTKPVFLDYLKRVNVVVVPFENPDGAILCYEQQKDPKMRTWILHDGRYNAVQSDVVNHHFKPDTLYTEALVKPKTWRLWLPDVFEDAHGFQSHEAVEPFAGYTAPRSSAYWIPRATFYGFGRYMATKEGPVLEGAEVAKAIYNRMYYEFSKTPDLMEGMNAWIERYKKYAYNWLPSQFTAEYIGEIGEEVLIYFSPSRLKTPYSNDFFRGYPWITTLQWTSEIADETSQGKHMDVAARLHYYPHIAQVEVLCNAEHNIQRISKEVNGQIYLKVCRIRPVSVSASQIDVSPVQVQYK